MVSKVRTTFGLLDHGLSVSISAKRILRHWFVISSSYSLQCIIGKSEDKPYNLDQDKSCHELVFK